MKYNLVNVKYGIKDFSELPKAILVTPDLPTSIYLDLFILSAFTALIATSLYLQIGVTINAIAFMITLFLFIL